MLMLMPTEDNSNVINDGTPKIDGTGQSAPSVINPSDTSSSSATDTTSFSSSSSISTPTETPSLSSTPSISPDPFPSPTPSEPAPAFPSPSPDSSAKDLPSPSVDPPSFNSSVPPSDAASHGMNAASQSSKLAFAKKINPKYLIAAVVLLLVIGVSAAAGYSLGKSKNKVPAVAAPKPINLPPEAIVINECLPGRGKQYAIPQEIQRGGPIYDVKNSKVIAIEYVLGMRALATNSDEFSSTLLRLTKDYPVDHFSVVPEPPKPTDTDQYIHLIMFIVPKSEAASITCT